MSFSLHVTQKILGTTCALIQMLARLFRLTFTPFRALKQLVPKDRVA